MIKVKNEGKTIIVTDKGRKVIIRTFEYRLRFLVEDGSYEYLLCSCYEKLNTLEELANHLIEGHIVAAGGGREDAVSIARYLKHRSVIRKVKAKCRICGQEFNFLVSEYNDYICSDCATRKQPIYGSPLNPREIPAVSQHRVVPTGHYRWPTQTKTGGRSRSKKIVIDI